MYHLGSVALIFCLEDLSIDVSGVLRSPTIIVFPSVSPFMSVSFCFMYLGVSILGAYMLTSVECKILFLYWSFYHYIVSFFVFMAFVLKSVLSDMSIATPAFLSFPFAWNIFFHPLTFNLCVSFALKWIFCMQHNVGSCFFYPVCHTVSFDWSIQSIDI